MPYANEEIKEVRCPKCGGHTWDNRETKRNPKAPDYKCKDKACDGAVWPEKKGHSNGVPQPTSKPVATERGDKTPYSAGPHIPAIDGPVDTTKLQNLFTVYGLCLDHVLTVEVPKLDRAKIGASPESVSSMTSALLIQASKL